MVVNKYLLIILNVTQPEYVSSKNIGKVLYFESISVETIHLQNEVAK